MHVKKIIKKKWLFTAGFLQLAVSSDWRKPAVNGYRPKVNLLLCLLYTFIGSRALTRILNIGVKTLPTRKSWSFTIHFYWHFSKSWSQIQKVGVKNSKFGVNETSGINVLNDYMRFFTGLYCESLI